MRAFLKCVTTLMFFNGDSFAMPNIADHLFFFLNSKKTSAMTIEGFSYLDQSQHSI